MSKSSSRYSDIIDLPHHQSIYRPHMTVYNRAAQFAPFAALNGYEQMVQDTADTLLLNRQIIKSEDEKMILDRKLRILMENINLQPEFTVFYFDEQANKLGGAYVMYSGKLKRLKEYPPTIIFVDGKKVLIEDIVNINGAIFED